jgi:polyisoprenoid-binding protein YceI
MQRRRFIIISAALATAVIAAAAVWWFLLRSDAPAPVSLDEAVAAATSSTTAAADAPATSREATTSDAVIEGSWSVITGNGSFAGYRVEEELASIGFTTAAGRTADLAASLEIAGDSVTAVDVTVNMQSLESDDSRRDRAIRSQALETNAFPTASFRLTEPIALPATAAAGEPFAVTAVGDLELHGATNQIELALEAQLLDGVIAVVGSAPILFSDYGIDPPQAPILLGVDDNGLMEFQLLFEQG